MGSGTGAFCSIELNTTLSPEDRALYQNEQVIATSSKRVANYCRRRFLGGAPEGKPLRCLLSQVRRVSHHPGESTGRRDPRREGASRPCGASPEPIDIVDVFRPAHEVGRYRGPGHSRYRAGAVWLQLRIFDFEAAARAREAGLVVVMDKCVKMEHGRFGGSLHWAGMNTEIISARKALLARSRALPEAKRKRRRYCGEACWECRREKRCNNTHDLTKNAAISMG